MDSSRSGLLSTLLMTLPLIVVPAIALLRPPGQPVGVSMSPLDASDSSDDDFLGDFDDLDTGLGESDKSQETPSGENSPAKGSTEFDGIFRDDAAAPEKPNSKSGTETSERTRPRGESDSFMPPNSSEGDVAFPDPEGAEEPSDTTDEIIAQLNADGALRTMWFEAGPQSPVGFAAFFRGQTELMRIRFEAVGRTREECARNVFDQVKQWQAEQAAPKR